MARIVVTGAAGQSGRLVAQDLAATHDVAAADLRDPGLEGVSFSRCDVTRYDDVRAAIEGAEIVLHIAGLHPQFQYTEEQYVSVNVLGTWNVFKAAAETKCRRVVFASSIAATGYTRRKRNPVRESDPLLPDDLYGVTKVQGETIGERFSRAHGLEVICLRLGCFITEDIAQHGLRLLAGMGVDPQDVVQAWRAAVQCQPSRPFSAFFITAPTPYTPGDVADLAEKPGVLVNRYYPLAWGWLKRKRLAPIRWGMLYDLSRSRRELGYRPKRDFAWFLDTCGFGC